MALADEITASPTDLIVPNMFGSFLIVGSQQLTVMWDDNGNDRAVRQGVEVG
jgi:hypothetical protein